MNGMIVIVGVGKLGEALVDGWLRSRAYGPETLAAVTRTPEAADRTAARYGIAATDRPESMVPGAATIVLCVKPAGVLAGLKRLAPLLRPGTTVVSTAAGIPLAALAAILPEGTPLFRAMPNLPVRVLAGMTALAGAASEDDSSSEHTAVEGMFKALGEIVWVDEKHLAAVTALSGSGPAYISLILEAFTDGGVKVGLPRATAYKLALATLAGSAQLLERLNVHPAVLRDDVMTPAGVAIAGMHEMERAGLRSTLITTVEVATLRARELADLAVAAIGAAKK